MDAFACPKEKHPLLLSKRPHVSKLILNHYHQEIHHQRRQSILGALQNVGYWLVGGHGAVASVMGSCVTCKRLGGPMLDQQMADLDHGRGRHGGQEEERQKLKR